ncbi:MAG: single-stranded DNA-binding protein [Chlamydiia bacterium]|nr:single-stranded DNA-binding protein [Chlamydiia bacterium]
MNHLMIMGHLGADPEVRFTSGGQKVTTLRLACNQKRGGKEETFWWRVTIWGEQFDKIMPYLKKGSALIVNGEMMKPEIYTNKEGQPQISLNMVAHNISFPPFGRGDRGEGGGQQEQHSYSQQGSGFGGQMQQGQGDSSHHQQEQYQSAGFSEDEIPF